MSAKTEAIRLKTETAGSGFVGNRCVEGVLLESYVDTGSKTEYPAHAHAEFMMGVGIDAFWECRQNGRTHLISSGSLVLHHPDQVHSARSLSVSGPTPGFRLLRVDVSAMHYAAQEVNERRGKNPIFVRPVQDNPEIAAQLVRFHLDCLHGIPRLQRESRLLWLLAEISRECGESSAPPLPAMGWENGPIGRVRAYLRERYAEDVSLDDLAIVARMSRFHLLRVFRATVGIPPHAYLTHVRLDAARVMLKTGRSPAETAAATGFADQSHFGRLFRRREGISPRCFQRSARNWRAQEIGPEVSGDSDFSNNLLSGGWAE